MYASLEGITMEDNHPRLVYIEFKIVNNSTIVVVSSIISLDVKSNLLRELDV